MTRNDIIEHNRKYNRFTPYGSLQKAYRHKHTKMAQLHGSQQFSHVEKDCGLDSLGVNFILKICVPANEKPSSWYYQSKSTRGNFEGIDPLDLLILTNIN